MDYEPLPNETIGPQQEFTEFHQIKTIEFVLACDEPDTRWAQEQLQLIARAKHFRQHDGKDWVSYTDKNGNAVNEDSSFIVYYDENGDRIWGSGWDLEIWNLITSGAYFPPKKPREPKVSHED